MIGWSVVGLADLELFAAVPADELAALEAQLAPVTAAAGETLMREGEPGDAFVLIVEGEAQVTRGGTDRGTVGPGSIIGELALLRGGPRTATVTATTPLEGLCGHAEAFAALAAAPGVREHFGRTAAQRLVAYARTVHTELADGTPVELRPVVPDDRAEFVDVLDHHFSQESRRKRFFTPGKVPASLITYLVDVDYVDHFAWVVLTRENSHLRGVASTRYIRLHEDPEIAEIALGVADDFQGRGVGKLLLGALAAAAPVNGITAFRANVLSENRPMRAVLDRFGARWAFAEPGVVETTVAVADIAGLLAPDVTAALHDAAQEIVAAASLALA